MFRHRLLVFPLEIETFDRLKCQVIPHGDTCSAVTHYCFFLNARSPNVEKKNSALRHREFGRGVMGFQPSLCPLRVQVKSENIFLLELLAAGQEQLPFSMGAS